MDKEKTTNKDGTIIETRYTVGPGLRMALVFLALIITLTIGFAGGWFMCKNSVIGKDKANQVEVLKSDTKEGLRLVKAHKKASEKLREGREGRTYDKDCGDKLISDILGK